MNAFPPDYFVEFCEAKGWAPGDPAVITYETAAGEISAILGTIIGTGDEDFTMIYVAPNQVGGIVAETSYDPEEQIHLLQIRHAAILEIAQVFSRSTFEPEIENEENEN